MNDISLEALCDVLKALEPFPAIVKKLDRWGCRYNSQKAHVLDWFASQSTLGYGAYSRHKPNKSAETCYNRLMNPGMLIWIAAALGADSALIEQATQSAIEAEKQNYRKRCGAFRAVIPFSAVIDLLGKPDRWLREKM